MQSQSGSPSSQHFDELDVDLRRLLMLLWRRKTIVILIMIVAMAVAFFVTSILPTRYTAKSLVLIETESLNHSSLDLQNFMSNMRIDTALVLSEVEVLKSQELGRRVVEKLNMMPEASGDKAAFKTLSVMNADAYDEKGAGQRIVDQDMARIVTA